MLTVLLYDSFGFDKCVALYYVFYCNLDLCFRLSYIYSFVITRG